MTEDNKDTNLTNICINIYTCHEPTHANKHFQSIVHKLLWAAVKWCNKIFFFCIKNGMSRLDKASRKK